MLKTLQWLPNAIRNKSNFLYYNLQSPLWSGSCNFPPFTLLQPHGWPCLFLEEAKCIPTSGPLYRSFPFQNAFLLFQVLLPTFLVSLQMSSLQRHLFPNISAKDIPVCNIPYPITLLIFFLHISLPESILFTINVLFSTCPPECTLHEDSNLDLIIAASSASTTVFDT